LRKIALSLCTAVFFITLFGNHRADARPASDDLKKIDSFLGLFPQLNASALEQNIPKATKLKKSSQSYHRLGSSADICAPCRKNRSIHNTWMPGVLSPKKDHHALLLLDLPPPSEPLKNPGNSDR
jgi:hypothetical protein